MEIKMWLEEHEAPEHMPNIDLIYEAGAENIDFVFDPSVEDEGDEEDYIDEIVLDVTLPDDLEKAIDVMVALAHVMLDTSRVKRLLPRVVQFTTCSPYDYYKFDWTKVLREEE